MIAKRIPHQLVLALALGLVAIGFCATIIEYTVAALRQQDDTVDYAATELHGIRCFAHADAVLRRLVRFRAELIDNPARARTTREGITAAISGICARPSAENAVDIGVAEQLGALRKQWSRIGAARAISAGDVTAVIATMPPLLTRTLSASGVTNDPSIDGINFGGALLRFPSAFAEGSEAATVALASLAANDTALPARFAAARLLARAQTAVGVARADVEDEMAVDAATGASLMHLSLTTVHDFEVLERRITDAYVENRAPSGRSQVDRRLFADLDRFTISSFVVTDALREALLAVTTRRIEQARRDHARLLWGSVVGIAIEFVLMLSLGWASIANHRDARRRQAAERSALESQRSQLEAQLIQAQAQQELWRAEAQFRAVFDRAPIGMVIVDRACRSLDSNEVATAMFAEAGWPIDVADLIAEVAPMIKTVFNGQAGVFSEERSYADPTGRKRWMHVSISPVPGDCGEPIFAIVMLRDISASKALEERLVFDAGHDALTGLPNRNQFVTLLQQALDRRDAEPAELFSVVFIDFNDFKTINDSLGHAAGDAFLIEGAARLRGAVRSTDVVARIGGDEFALMLYGNDRSDIENSVTRLQAVLTVPVEIDNQSVASSASFGIAQAEPHYALAAEIIRDADTAMYAAKAQGGRSFVVFDASMRERVVRRMRLANDIAHAIDHNELILLFQPIVDLRDGTLAGCEALLRWRRSDGELIAPVEFLPLAEENGSIVEIGHWVIHTACAQLRAWHDAARSGASPAMNVGFVMHVNLSVPEMHHVELLAILERTIDDTRIARSQIILEITEGVVLKLNAPMRTMLDNLTRAGFRLCIDDFGTGYSSLRYLNELPLYGFKIDRAFVSQAGCDDLANGSIVEMLLALGRSLGLEVVAEGIETPTQWNRLRELGCQFGQGYLFAQALDAPAFTALLQTGRPAQLTA